MNKIPRNSILSINIHLKGEKRSVEMNFRAFSMVQGASRENIELVTVKLSDGGHFTVYPDQDHEIFCFADRSNLYYYGLDRNGL